MNGKEKIAVERFIYVLIIAMLLLSLLPLYDMMHPNVSFGTWLEPVHTEKSGIPDHAIHPVPEPAEAYSEMTLTFGGLCIPASMMGSDSYGTFNAEFQEKGADSFFRRLTEYTDSDDFTLVGCSAVFSDREDLTAVEREKPEWYRAPAETARIFPEGGVDGVLLTGERLGDYGADGFDDTVKALTEAGVLWGYDGACLIADLRENLRIAAYAVPSAADESEQAVVDDDTVAWIQGRRAEGTLIVLYVPGGEDSYEVEPAKEVRFRSFIDAGANLVIGIGGSKLQRAEEYGGGMIAYSLGSLLDGTTKYPEKTAALLRAHLKINSGDIREIRWEWIPVQTYTESGSWRPAVLTEETERNAALAFLQGETEQP